MGKTTEPAEYYVLQGHYGGGTGWEDLTADDSWSGIRQSLRDYRDNATGRYRIITRRTRDEGRKR
jgi:hypothetical protein